MIDSLDVRPEAEEEVLRAYAWYEAQRTGLGEEFLSCVDAVFSQICRAPEMFPVVHEEVRRVLTRKFPYGVFYMVQDRRVVVLAVYHGSRDPSVWKQRA